MTKTKLRRVGIWAAAGTAIAGAFTAGALLLGTASAQETDTDSTSTSESTDRDETKAHHPDEELLTGTNAEKARAAALKEYPGATIERAETDSDGVYEAHLVTAAGERVTVEFDKNFAVTGEEQGGPGGPGGPPPHNDDEDTEEGGN